MKETFHTAKGFVANKNRRSKRPQGMGFLDALPDAALDSVTELACSICETPIAVIALVDQDGQWFKSARGLDIGQMDPDRSFCAHAILEPTQVMEVQDATTDVRFAAHPMVTGEPNIRFYAGAPIVTSKGVALGAVCVLDRVARRLSGGQRRSLEHLAGLAARLLEHSESVRAQSQARFVQWEQEEEFLQAVSSAALDLTSYVDRTYTYRFANDAYLKYWERRREEIVGKSVASLLGEDMFQKAAKPALDRAFGGQVVSYESVVNFPGKGERHVKITYLPSGARVGVPCKGVVVRVQDIHELKSHELELEKTVQLLERKTIEQQRFIHIVSHDLREPLNSINNFTSLLVQDHRESLPLEAQRYLDYVSAGGARMTRLLNDLIRFTELENYTLDLEAVDLNLLAAQVRDDLLSATLDVGAQLHIDEMPVVQGNASFLRIALQNLVSNALKFRHPLIRPMVRVSSITEGSDVVLQVEDNGIGISDEHQAEVFDAFRRLHNRRTYEGTGLGLAICKRIAQMHGGWLSVKSEPGVGSCFSLHLPSCVSTPSGDPLA